MTETASNAPDLLYGVAGNRRLSRRQRRTAYHLCETKRIPYFKVGRTVCGKRSKIAAALERFEEGE